MANNEWYVKLKADPERYKAYQEKQKENKKKYQAKIKEDPEKVNAQAERRKEIYDSKKGEREKEDPEIKRIRNEKQRLYAVKKRNEYHKLLKADLTIAEKVEKYKTDDGRTYTQYCYKTSVITIWDK